MRLSTPPRVLLPQKAASYAPAWLTDGRVAFLSNRDIEQAVYAMRPGDAEPTLLASRPTHDSLLEPLRTGRAAVLHGQDGVLVRGFAGWQATPTSGSSSPGNPSPALLTRPTAPHGAL